MAEMNAVDLFCGCGGMSLGFQNAGFNVIAAFDNWKPAIEVYKKNFQHAAFQRDVADEETAQIVRDFGPDIIIGGPPCQDFSTAGLRDEKLGRAQLTITFSDIVTKTMPEFFVMENVPIIQKSALLDRAVEAFKSAGYGLTQKVLDASYCGVPQSRKRFFLIGHLGGKDGFLDRYLEENLADKPMTIYDYLGDTIDTEYYFRMPTNYSRRGVYSIYEPSVTIRGVERPIPKGYRRHRLDPVPIGPEVRTLTIKERSYLQTFPEHYIFLERSKSNLNQMIGNAVPVKLAEYVGTSIQRYCEDLLVMRGDVLLTR